MPRVPDPEKEQARYNLRVASLRAKMARLTPAERDAYEAADAAAYIAERAAEEAARQTDEQEWGALRRAHAQAEQVLKKAKLYAETGKKLREATRRRRQTHHCHLCGYKFGKANLNKLVCDETVGDADCLREQERRRGQERRAKKPSRAPRPARKKGGLTECLHQAMAEYDNHAAHC